MDKASRREHQSKPSMAVAEAEVLSSAISKVVGALTQVHGADCILYAAIGAAALRLLGFPEAKMVAGEAAWRVGPGDGDVISHAKQIVGHSGQVFNPGTTAHAAMFHAWIEVGDEIVDFTTPTLRHKAEQLDAADHGHTQVDWAPEVLWTSKRESKTPKGVAASFDTGVFAYVRDAVLEKTVFQALPPDFDAEHYANYVLVAFRALKAGSHLQVVGLGEDAQTLDSARQAARAKGLRPA